MAGGEYSANSKPFMLVNAISESRRRRLNMQMTLHHLISRTRHVFTCLFPSFVVDFLTKKQHHYRSAILSSVEQKYWLVRKGMDNILRRKIQENIPNIAVYV